MTSQEIIKYRLLTRLGNFHLDRVEALSLLKELTTLGIVQPTFVSVEKNEQGTFYLTLKVNGNLSEPQNNPNSQWFR